MSTPQYRDLDDPEPSQKKEDQENNWRQNQSIELDVQTLSVNKIQFLKKFIESSSVQALFTQMLQ
jgi:hypothetical protein